MHTLDDDDFPSTHMEDDEYDAFVARELDSEGGLRGDPPVTRIIVGAVVLLVVLALWLLL